MIERNPDWISARIDDEIVMMSVASGTYLGLNPDTLICGPRLEFAVKQLLLSDNVQRVGGNTTNETRGTGTTNTGNFDIAQPPQRGSHQPRQLAAGPAPHVKLGEERAG